MINTKQTSISIDGNNYQVFIIRKKMKRIIVKVTEYLEIKIHCPLNCSYDDAYYFMSQNIDWIKSALNRQLDNYQSMQIEYCMEYKKIWLKGILYNICNTDDHNKFYQIEGNNIYIPNNIKNLEKIIETIRASLYGYIEEEFNKIQLYLKNIIKNESHLVLKNLKSKWGVCNYKTGQITINKRLVHVPTEVLDYVIVHEFVHFLHPNHGKLFHETLSKILVNYRYYEKVLKAYNFVLKN